MIDIQKQIEHWRKGAEEDLSVGFRLVREGSVRHGLFFVHLAIEKILKAHVCHQINDLAPPSHNLGRLLELSTLKLPKGDVRFIVNLNKYNIQGRYPDSYDELPGSEELSTILTEGERIFSWLRDQL